MPCEAIASPQPQRRCGGFSVGNGAITGSSVTLGQLAAELPTATDDRYVFDRTELDGTFDISLTWDADALRPDAPVAGHAASIFVAMQEKLGLKLEPTTAPIDVTVIDRAERPEEN